MKNLNIDDTSIDEISRRMNAYEAPLLDQVERIAKNIGYGRIMQAMAARWALSLVKQYELPVDAAMRGAFITDSKRLMAAEKDPESAIKELIFEAGYDRSQVSC